MQGIVTAALQRYMELRAELFLCGQAVNRRLIQHIRFQRTQPYPTDARYGAGGLYCVTERSTPLLTVGGEVDTGQYHFRIPFCRQLAQLLRQLFQRL